MGKRPSYSAPNEKEIGAAIEEAEYNCRIAIGEFKLVSVNPKQVWVEPDVQALLMKDLVDAYKDDPSEIPPVVITRQDNRWTIVDGRHRLKAAIEAKVPILWAVAVKVL